MMFPAMAATDRAERRERPGVAVLLLVAALSALLVVAAYEVSGRRGRRSAEHEPEATPPTAETSAPPPRPGPPRVESCARLRRTYLASCPQDLPIDPPAPLASPPAPGARNQDQARAAADLAVWLNPPPEELEELAKNCEVRFDIPSITDNAPPAVSDEDAAALSLSDAERVTLQRTLTDMHTRLHDFATQAVLELGGAPATSPSLEEALSDLQTRTGSGFEAARETLANERAGRAQPPAPDRPQPPGERLLRLWAGLGDDLEHQLAAKLGQERAHQLRTAASAGWMNRFSQSGCRARREPAAPQK